MSENDDDDLEEYIFQGKEGEEVPKTVEKLIIAQDVQILPEGMCYHQTLLKQVTLSYGLVRIDRSAFYYCEDLLEIKIPSTVQYIGEEAFLQCFCLTKVDFEFSTSSPQHHQLRTIEKSAFNSCRSLLRIKVPSSVTTLGELAFRSCDALIEADLSTTGVTKISDCAFAGCRLLQTASLPNTLEWICEYAFYGCFKLVTVVIPLDSNSIEIEEESFSVCKELANLVLPKDSAAEEDSFAECRLLHERYGGDSSGIVAGLVGRFENCSIHRLCYDHSTATLQELRKCIADHQEEGALVDEFGMTPFHVFFSTIEPRIELLDVLLESLPNHILNSKDANGRRPLDYLVNNWADGTKHLLQRTLQKWMMDLLDRWGATSWKEAMESTLQDLLAEDEDNERARLYYELYSDFEHYENLQATSILEMALWKWKLKSGRASGGSKKQALDRDECRCLSGSDVIIPHVTMFLGIRS